MNHSTYQAEWEKAYAIKSTYLQVVDEIMETLSAEEARRNGVFKLESSPTRGQLYCKKVGRKPSIVCVGSAGKKAVGASCVEMLDFSEL